MMRAFSITCAAALLIATAAGAQTQPLNQMPDGPRLDTGKQLNTDARTAGRSPQQAALAKRLQARSAKNNCATVKDRKGKTAVHCTQPK